MTDLGDIEALGIKVPKAKEHEQFMATHLDSEGKLTQFLRHPKSLADAALGEAYAVITRLAWERGCAIGWLQSLGKHEVEEALSYAWDTSGRRPQTDAELGSELAEARYRIDCMIADHDETRAELAALRADRTEILDSAWNTAHERAETAEAARREERDKRVLAEERQRFAEAELEATIESFSAENRELQKRRHSVEAEATEVERILELAWEDQTTNPRRFPDGMPKYRHWLADLKARAQEPSA